MTNQTAITILKNLEQCLDDYCELNDEGKKAFCMAITALELFGNAEQLPSIQPEKAQLSGESSTFDTPTGIIDRPTDTPTDCISRQMAIDCLCNGKCAEEGRWCDDGDCMPVRRIKSLPSAQPEENCDTCKHGYFGDSQCNNCRVGYPSHYERRTDDGE